MNVLEAIERSRARLDQAGVSFGHGTDNAFDEAVWLVLWCLGLALDELDGVAARELDAGEQAAVDALVGERIATRKPAAYLTHEAWLQGVPFYVDERAIVPRSLIAEPLVDGAIDAWLMLAPRSPGTSSDPPGGCGPAWERPGARPAADTRRVLDLCTGNGSLAVLAALAWPEVAVDASDLSADALDVARINVERHGLADRIALRLSDGLAQLPGPYDLILCNPPYVNAASMAALPPEYQAEPALALAGGADGMDFVRTLLRDAPQKMNEHAVLVLEIGHERANFERAFPRLDAVWLPTSAGDDQVLLLSRDAIAS